MKKLSNLSMAKLAALKKELQDRKQQWLDKVFANRGYVDGNTFKVAFGLGKYMTMDLGPEGYETTASIYLNTDRVHIWPTQRELAEICDLSDNTVSRCINTLIERRHLRLVKRGNKFNGSNRYEVLL